ncbi:hypothetical protein jhhlp_005310 [Lomentospora prolificans]|uniref:Zn(2)-C6 fungal-type domain-containing protein n=1 Tax=Lomentospora prolificans TaxID=41688 RepID=A0A2N3N7F3_9PEZI|nr:hypothetical protein jhhlp_005310 [Lomentospora prolificans]
MAPAPRTGPQRMRPHRKSRNGCLNCKRRKVKCDEEKPHCTSCVRFNLSCSFTQPPSSIQSSRPTLTQPERSPPRRGRGRPRKDWTLVGTHPEHDDASSDTLSSSSSRPTPTSSAETECLHWAQPLHVTDAELIFHFISSVAPTFVCVDGEEVWRDPIIRFWKDNVPRLALNHHFLLHLVYAIAGYHLAYIQEDGHRRHEYLTIAESHLSQGVAEMTRLLPDLNADNCQPLYVGAVLVCYCTFAAGPSSPSDLMICIVGDETAHQCMPMIHGVRLINRTMDPNVLYSGLMAPLRPKEDGPKTVSSPTYRRENFDRLNWEEALDTFHAFMGKTEHKHSEIYLSALDTLISTYEAIFGRGEGHYNGSSEFGFVFGWIYRLTNDYISCLQRCEPLALLILAYYAVLFQTLTKSWFMDSWMNHIISRVAEMVGPEYGTWLLWPLEQHRKAEKEADRAAVV